MLYPFLIFSQSDYLIQIVDIILHSNGKQCRSRSVGFFRSQLIWIYTVCKRRTYPGSAGQGLRRFILIRGTPVEILSDNASQFKTASSVLDLAWKHVTKCEGVQCFVSNSGIKWSFTIELAPWMGGFYQRLVGLVKRALRKLLGRNLLKETQLQTLL